MKISPDMREMIDRAVNAGQVKVIPPGVATGVQSAPIPKKRGRPRVVPLDETATEKRERRARAAAGSLRDRRRFKVTPVATGKPVKTAPADATGTVYPTRVFDPMPTEGVLKDGCSNSKIGGDVLKGHLKGARIYTLTLEERATCPKSCNHWRTCFAPRTRILTADLQWVPIEQLGVGQQIVCFDEDLPETRRRTYKTGAVQALRRVEKPRCRVNTNLGSILVTGDHLFLARRVASSVEGRKGYQWYRADSLRPGDTIQFLAKPWETPSSYDAGRFRGFLEGEGSMSLYDGDGFNKVRLSYSQRPGAVLNQINQTAENLGFSFAHRECRSGVRNNRVVQMTQLGGFREVMRLVGSIRPTRFIERGSGIYDGQVIDGRGSTPAVVHGVEAVEVGPVYEISTTERTLIAEGFLAHNCYGNGMPHPRRWKHGPELEAAIEAEVKALCATFPKVLVRLHVLGDFYSFDYLALWVGLLDDHPNLNLFGFTAWPPGTKIGDGIARARDALGQRFSIRHSGRTGKWGSFTVDGATERRRFGDAIVCPEQVEAERQTGRHCGNCALCWHSSLPIVFREH